jgi:hypothetical protein
MSPVSRVVAGPDIRNGTFLSREISCTASATAELGTSAMASTPSRSIHCRVTEAPTSALFW